MAYTFVYVIFFYYLCSQIAYSVIKAMIICDVIHRA